MGSVEIPDWLKGLPLAPVYRPTDTEFADPIAYISKIEKEASAFGICKIVPPLPKPSKKYVFHNLNKSLLKCPELGSDVDSSKVGGATGGNELEVRAVFTTRQQELGQNAKRTRGENNNSNLPPCVHKQVWQSGEIYTLEQFESKSKAFHRSHLGMIKDVSPIIVESLFWKAASEKPIYIEYANDVPGSAFGEPEGHFRHIRQRRRRRRRGSYQRKIESSERNEIENPRNTHGCLELSCKNDQRPCPETEKASPSSPSLSSDEGSRSSRQKNGNSANDMEGTAGWKLSNTPWNLQMIARSSGSITRFMPDDIPGVTSPMVYIGMLFSWFAWHVEDHELHSMNFLHAGSPKTWYAVPGDYAIDFEEIIRTKAYGGKIDQLAALTLLGEKTTLLSPEVVVKSGIPCYRLIQNAGEFVVTFPRAYHVGFSHGFNCGEAANFATPQWLKAAKEAAVRRAAMNYLPMLSHQQLLYLLTMSFVSRVPRSLLPGARSSRFRDRLREERELLVKKAFIEDMLHENKTLSVLLHQEPSYRLVLWDPDLLPRHNKESLVAAGFTTVTTAVSSTPAVEGDYQGHYETQNNDKKTTLLEELSLYMENLSELCDNDDDDDLLNDFQVDSGTLACVACGILGFPFMSVVQPSEKALKILAERADDIGFPDSFLSREAPEISTQSFEKFENQWNMSCRYSRPRIFCLEHTVQLQKLLHSSGRLNVLIICHKDFQKIKAHATIVAEEVNIPFSYNDVPLGSASQEDLSLIDLAIEDEETNEHGEDWTSKLGFNLRYCVKVRKNSPTKPIQHALSLGGLFSSTSQSPDFSNIKWQMRKLRSKAKRSRTFNCKPCKPLEAKADGRLGEELGDLDSRTGRKEEKIIQYSRRKKLRPRSFGERGLDVGSAAKSEDFDNASDEHASRSERQLENSVVNVTRFVPAASSSLHDKNAFTSATACANGSSENTQNEKPELSNPETEHLASVNDFVVNHEIGARERTIAKNVALYADNLCSSSFTGPHGQELSGKNPKSVDESCSASDENLTYSSSKSHVQQVNLAIQNNHNDKSNPSCDVLVTRRLSTSIGNDCDGPEESRAECTPEDLSFEDFQKPPRTGNQDSEEPDSCVINIEDGQESQAVELSNKEAVLDARTFTEGDQAVGLLQVSSPTCEVSCYDEELCSKNISNAGEQQEQHKHSSAQLGLEVPAGNHTNEKTVVEITGDGESLAIKQVNGHHTSLPLGRNGLQTLNSEHYMENLCSSSDVSSSRGYVSSESTETIRAGKPNTERESKKRKTEPNPGRKNQTETCTSFIRSPCEGLRPRAKKEATCRDSSNKDETSEDEKFTAKRAKKPSNSHSAPRQDHQEVSTSHHSCNLEGCRMSFESKADLQTHKRNRCTHEGCGKKFRAHKYLLLHQRVHNDDRPFKCPWKGCSMSFKWQWARTEHLRLHTGERPYKCKVEGCGLSFRFVSDYSRHRRKTGHYVN